jgi:hypothetical protein
LAAKIREVASDPERLRRMAQRSLETAQEYADERLRQQRLTYYQAVREATADWLAAGSQRRAGAPAQSDAAPPFDDSSEGNSLAASAHRDHNNLVT